mmetsp:Transcript_60384/g.51106  ORF Transcript_60384/g.51106 Transcript_60384/m.51106 type:complete len:251 (+) Transcript_60384:1311-2063(+)
MIGEFTITDAPNKKAALVNTKPTYNMLLDKSPATLVYYKAPTFQCLDMCIIRANLRFDGNLFGSATIGFKFTNPLNYYMLVIHKHMPKISRVTGKEDLNSSKIRLSRFNKNPKTLQFVKFPNIKNKWMRIELRIVQNKITVVINKNIIFQDFIELDEKTHADATDNISGKRGTLAFGINGTLVQFANINVSAIKPPKSMQITPQPLGESGDADPVDDDPALTGGTNDPIVPEQARKVDCMSINTRESRKG